VSQPSPLTEISSRYLEGDAVLTGTANSRTFPNMVTRSPDGRTEEVITLPSFFFLRVITPLYLEELDRFMPRDTILLIQNLGWVLGV
jgi:hypothetical protein